MITEAPSRVWNYFGGSVPLTLKTVVLKSGVDVANNLFFSGITGVTIYVEDEKIDCPWDHDYPRWNNGNKVYYGGEWSEVTFTSDGNVLSDEIYLSSQIIRLPYVGNEKSENIEKTFLGWDFDGDGMVDSLPATLIGNVTAEAVFETKEATYQIDFMDKDGQMVLYSYVLPFGALVPCPADPGEDRVFLPWLEWVL